MRSWTYLLSFLFFGLIGQGVSACARETIAAPSQPPPEEIFGPKTQKIIIEMDYASGASPYSGSFGKLGDIWSMFNANVEKLFEGAGKTLELPTGVSEMTEITGITGTTFTAEQILDLSAMYRKDVSKDGDVAFYIIWINGYYQDSTGTRKDVLGITLRDRGVTAMFKPVIKTAENPRVSVLAPFVEQSTLIHEFGHNVGLVNNGVALTTQHQDTAHGAHCTNKNCAMYYANEGARDLVDFAESFIATSNKVLYGSECLADVDALKE